MLISIVSRPWNLMRTLYTLALMFVFSNHYFASYYRLRGGKYHFHRHVSFCPQRGVNAWLGGRCVWSGECTCDGVCVHDNRGCAWWQKGGGMHSEGMCAYMVKWVVHILLECFPVSINVYFQQSLIYLFLALMFAIYIYADLYIFKKIIVLYIFLKIVEFNQFV